MLTDAATTWRIDGVAEDRAAENGVPVPLLSVPKDEVTETKGTDHAGG